MDSLNIHASDINKVGGSVPGATTDGGLALRKGRKTRRDVGHGQVQNDTNIGDDSVHEESDSSGQRSGGAAIGGSTPAGPTNVRVSPALLAKMEASMASEDTPFEETLRDAPTVAAFIVLSLSKALNLRPRQVTALVTTNTRYLIHVLAKGLKGKS